MKKTAIIWTIIGLLIMASGVCVYLIEKANRKPPEPLAIKAESVERERADEYLDTLKAIEEENNIDALIKKYGDVAFHYVTLDMSGSEIFSADAVAREDSVTYFDSLGKMEYLTGGKWIGYDPEEKSIYTMVLADDAAYSQEWDYLKNSATFSFDELTVTESVKKTGGKVCYIRRTAVLTEENTPLFQNTWGDLVQAGDKFLDEYTFGDDEEFIMEVYSIQKGDDKYELGRVICIYGSGIEADPSPMEIAEAEDKRALTLHMDYGTDDYKTITQTTGTGTEFVFALPDGYEDVYIDKECKTPLSMQDFNDDLEVYIYKGH